MATFTFYIGAVLAALLGLYTFLEDSTGRQEFTFSPYIPQEIVVCTGHDSDPPDCVPAELAIF
jgi:hypothetical protein